MFFRYLGIGFRAELELALMRTRSDEKRAVRTHRPRPLALCPNTPRWRRITHLYMMRALLLVGHGLLGLGVVLGDELGLLGDGAV